MTQEDITRQVIEENNNTKVLKSRLIDGSKVIFKRADTNEN